MVKQLIQNCFDGIGGIDALMDWARAHRTYFYTKVWTRILPMQVNVENQTVTYHTIEEVERAIAERALPIKRLTPLLLELEAEKARVDDE
jgi:hypothetical protein